MAAATVYRSTPVEQTLTDYLFDSTDIRTATSEDGQIWFGAKDICTALGLSWSGQTLQKMPPEWTCVISHIIQGDQSRQVTFINEPGMYRLAFRSSKPEAERFANWVCGEVLPSIRKHGYFGQMSPADEERLTKTTASLVRRMTETKDAFEQSFLIERVRRLFRMLGQPFPSTKLIGQSTDQLELEV